MIGTYVLRDDLLLATPPPHPSEGPPPNPNPLNTTIAPPTAGVKLSFAVIAPKHASYQRHRPETPTSASEGSNASREGSQHEGQSSYGSNTDSLFRPNGMGDMEGSQVTLFGHSNPALNVVNGKESKDPNKRRKPKNNMVKSSSTFISRVIPHEGLTKRLQEHVPEGLFTFANINRAFQWLDLSSPTKAEHLTKILFTKANVLCHDVNPITKSSSHLDVILGFNTGDIMWYEPMTQKYARLNKNASINAAAVADIRWMPGSENLFLAGCMDGSLVVYDKEKEDAPFVAEESSDGAITNGLATPRLKILKSVQSRNQKTNPVAFWKVSNQKINAFAFSPSGRHLAVVSEDGCLRIIDIHREVLLSQFTSYYGGLVCVCWSPDGRYVLTGGQDDLVSIWSLTDSALVARCQGHNSWVTAVAFDPWRCDERTYRFGSVGEDSRLLLWDFSVGMLHRPRAASVRQRGSVVSALPERLKSQESLRYVESGGEADGESIVRAVEPRARTAVLPPVMAKSIDTHPLSSLEFTEEAIITACRDGHIRTWDRPKEGAQGDNHINDAPSTNGST